MSSEYSMYTFIKKPTFYAESIGTVGPSLNYSSLKYPAARIIRPRSLHILFNAHNAHRAKCCTRLLEHPKMPEFRTFGA